jgi:diguanylate cyclase (GGDEF)-like protein
MSSPDASLGGDLNDAEGRSSAEGPTSSLLRIGEALNARTGDVVAGMLARSGQSPSPLGQDVEDSFARVGALSTVAVARWMSGEGEIVARQVGEEAWQIFGRLAAQRAAPLSEVTKRCLRWRDAAADVVRETAAREKLDDELLARALAMLQRSLDVTLVRMCQSFESERHRAQQELDRQREELEFLATHDPLTGLPNRALVLASVERLLARSRRQQTPVAAIFIDIDNFKTINDTLGHRAGDELLRALTARLQGVVREVDAFGRLGGDEFVVVAEGLSLTDGPAPIAERLLGALEQPFELAGHDNHCLTVTASVGIATGVRKSAEELLRDADIAMYQAKWAGKNRYVVFESAMQEAVMHRMELEVDLRVALREGQFFLVYQPTFDLRAMRPTGMETLIRWKHPTRGVLQPDDFVPVLEETGMIVEVGRWVLTQACLQGAAWHTKDYPVGVAVNVSAIQLERDDFVTEVQDALAQSGMDPSTLTIEITETTIMSDSERTAARLAAIRRLGVRVAIDDFGAGYSSLKYLQRFPVDILKIDRSFISRLVVEPDGEQLIRTLVQLGKSLSIETLAEGIEQSSVLSLLKEENCDSGQGFLFASPLDVDASESFLQAWAASAPALGAITASRSAAREDPPSDAAGDSDIPPADVPPRSS